jgi:hypothetical protein
MNPGEGGKQGGWGQTGNMLGIKLDQHIQIATRFGLPVQARAKKSQSQAESQHYFNLIVPMNCAYAYV